MDKHTGKRTLGRDAPVVPPRRLHPLIRGFSDYPMTGRISLAFFLLALGFMFPLAIAPAQSHSRLMLEGSNESAVITDSNWERVSGKSPTYDNHIRYTFSVDGSPHAGTAVRNVSHVDNKWSVGTTTSVKYLTPTDYDMVGNEGTGSSILLLLLLSFTATLALCIAITPFFWVYPRNDYEKKLLTRSASYADDGVPYTTMRPDSGLNSNDTYVSIQNKMREARGPASVLLTLSGAAVMAFFILSPGFLIFAPDSFAYGAGMFGCSVLAVFFLWLEGVYLRRGKHRTRYAYVRYIHDQIIRHRTETKKGAS